MKFEFVEYYQNHNIKSFQSILGTCHVYCIDTQMDFRGIMVIRAKANQKIILRIPYARGWDSEAKKEVRYPIFSFAKESDNIDFKQFLYEECFPIVSQKVDWTKIPAFKKFKKESIPSKAK